MLKQNKWRKFLMLTLFPLLSIQPALAQSPSADSQITDGIETRLGIVVRPNERTRILTNMRRYLTGIQEMTQALARDDMKAAAAAARAMGSINLYEVRLMFANEAGVDFRQLAFSVHKDFDRVAKDAEEKKDGKLMLGQVAEIIKKCVHCHETYRLQDTAH